MRNTNRRGYGNDAAMEITKRFPQQLGNLAQNARFPHSHSRLSDVDKNTDQDTNLYYRGVTNRLWEVPDLLSLVVESEGGKKSLAGSASERGDAADTLHLDLRNRACQVYLTLYQK